MEYIEILYLVVLAPIWFNIKDLNKEIHELREQIMELSVKVAKLEK
jgi:hypothetical protein